MSAFKQKLARVGATVGVLAASTAAIMAVGGVTASSALALPNCAPESTMIKGMGSSLQKSAQEVWTGRAVASVTKSSEIATEGTANSEANSYRAKCASATHPPAVTYGSSGSGPGLAAFRFTGTGTEINHELGFVASDDGPSATQITHAQEVSGGAKAVIVPVTQTAIAVVVHPPAGCVIEEITWGDLNKVFNGNGIKKWNEFSTKVEEVSGSCNAEITRVVRAEGSGTTYQFKNYLSELELHQGAVGLPCTVEGTTHWAGLREVGTGEKPNIVWPECTGHTPVHQAAGGGALAEYVQKNVNTIGYAALPDAKSKSATTVKLQNGVVSSTPHYAEPGKTSTKTARCENSRYTVPSNGRKNVGTGESVDWSSVYGAQPEIGGTEYPLCTLTYQVGWTNYSSAGYGTEATNIGNLVKDFITNYEVQTGTGLGQKAIEGHWYSALPSTVLSTKTTESEKQEANVQGAAELAASKLG
jgi:ABC-type phosphate transport system substrate-binding protein